MFTVLLLTVYFLLDLIFLLICLLINLFECLFIGLSKALQSFGSLLEGLFFIIGSTNQETKDDSSLYAIISSILNVFKCLNNRKLKALLSVEYTKTLVADTAHYCFNAISAPMVRIKLNSD